MGSLRKLQQIISKLWSIFLNKKSRMTLIFLNIKYAEIQQYCTAMKARLCFFTLNQTTPECNPMWDFSDSKRGVIVWCVTHQRWCVVLFKHCAALSKQEQCHNVTLAIAYLVCFKTVALVFHLKGKALRELSLALVQTGSNTESRGREAKVTFCAHHFPLNSYPVYQHSRNKLC